MKRRREENEDQKNSLSREMVLREVYAEAPQFAEAWCEMCSFLGSQGERARLARTTAPGIVLARALQWFVAQNLQRRHKKLLKKDVYALLVAMVYVDMDDFEAERLCIGLQAQGLLKRCKFAKPHEIALQAVTKYGMPRYEGQGSGPSHAKTPETDIDFFERVFRTVIANAINDDNSTCEISPSSCDNRYDRVKSESV